MIITVEELRQFVTTTLDDAALEMMIDAVESFITHYTNNTFVNRTTGNVEFPVDVKMGAINLIKWDLYNRDKLGIASETISRHSVSYTGMTATDFIGGFPAALTGFLKPYMKARF